MPRHITSLEYHHSLMKRSYKLESQAYAYVLTCFTNCVHQYSPDPNLTKTVCDFLGRQILDFPKQFSHDSGIGNVDCT